jgi:hypothetical protein
LLLKFRQLVSQLTGQSVAINAEEDLTVAGGDVTVTVNTVNNVRTIILNSKDYIYIPDLREYSMV